jgi:hypothetical protein
MKALRKFGALGVAMIVAVASLMLGATPASAAGDARYENVGNPGWCLDGDGTGDKFEAYLHRCGSAFQVWTVGDSGWMFVKQKVSGKCLQALPTTRVALGYCGETGTSWYATSKNGWVKFINYQVPYYPNGLCLQPTGTGVGGRSTYDLVVDWCNHNNHDADPKDLSDVPNIVAWRFH